MVGPGGARPGWSVPGGFLGERWALRMEIGGTCGARSGLVDIRVTRGMVMDETLHVLPGGGVGELLCVC